MFPVLAPEAVNEPALFPDDDSDAWELLIEWCYKGQLPPLALP